ncbi:MAG: hypothetical protein V4850_34815 [Myxococcota bacterium]
MHGDLTGFVRGEGIDSFRPGRALAEEASRLRWLLNEDAPYGVVSRTIVSLILAAQAPLSEPILTRVVTSARGGLTSDVYAAAMRRLEAFAVFGHARRGWLQEVIASASRDQLESFLGDHAPAHAALADTIYDRRLAPHRERHRVGASLRRIVPVAAPLSRGVAARPG